MKKVIIIYILLTGTFVVKAQVKKNFTLIMRTTGYIVLYDGDTARTFGFATKLSQNPPIPGPLIEVNEGDSVFVLAKNITQGPPHTIHWHGLDVDQANDGTPATSFELRHMEEATYKFKATHAGTYIYHCHMGDVVHVQMGMYGLVVVKAANAAKTAWTGGPNYDSEYAWLNSEIDKKWHDSIPATDHDSTQVGHEIFMIPKYNPTYFLVNGKSKQQIKADSLTCIKSEQNKTIYLRVGNIGNMQNRINFPKKLNAKIIDSDGRPLPTTFSSDSIWVSPGERYGVLLQSSDIFDDSISVEYINMNTHRSIATEWVPVIITKTNSIADINVYNTLQIFPNPTRDKFFIQFNEQQNIKYNLQIYNTSGQLCFEKQLVHNASELAGIGFSKGLYFVVITGGDGGQYSGKLLVD